MEDCTLGSEIVVSTTIPGDQTTFTLTAAPESDDDPLPYAAYEFMVGATNSEGSVNSTYSEPDTATPPGGKERVSDLSIRQPI